MNEDPADSNVTDLDSRRPHYAGWCDCYVCGHRWVAAIDARADLFALECGNCGRMTGTFLGPDGGPLENGKM